VIACYNIDEGDDLMNKKTLIIISIILVIIIPLICILAFQFSKEENNKNIIDENTIHISEHTNLQDNNILDNTVATDIETEDKTEIVEETKDELKKTEDKIENKKDTKEKNETKVETKDNNKDTKDEVIKDKVITNDKTEIKPQTVEKTEDKNVIEKNEIAEEEQKTNNETVQTNTEAKEEEKKKIDLSKYDYYEESLNGTYKAFIKDTADMSVLKSLINECITEFGYTDVKVLQDESLPRSGVAYFTTNKYNVENLVYDTEGFTIYYYSVKEYHIASDGTATYFQTRAYIKVR